MIFSLIFPIFENVTSIKNKMKKLLSLTLVFLCICSLSAQEYAYFLTDPAISPDGSTIVFVYESDLWIADRSGGTAHRLTAMEGDESLPCFSPDGRWLAFSSTQNGNADIYVMPVEGGSITQLTYHDGNDYADSWSWDSKTVYFTSDRYNTQDTGYRRNTREDVLRQLF
jgi:tricorn protease